MHAGLGGNGDSGGTIYVCMLWCIVDTGTFFAEFKKIIPTVGTNTKKQKLTSAAALKNPQKCIWRKIYKI